MNSETIRRRDTELTTRLMRNLQDGQTFKTECYTAGGWATITRQGDSYAVKLPKQRAAQVLPLAAAVAAVVNAHLGAE